MLAASPGRCGVYFDIPSFSLLSWVTKIMIMARTFRRDLAGVEARIEDIVRLGEIALPLEPAFIPD